MMFFKDKAKLGENITSYDLLKCLALILMTIDHIGFYFFPDNQWYRAIGRGCLPIWFGLIGYANTRELPLSFWVGGFILVAVNIMLGLYILPLNILFTMLFIRFSIDHVVRIYFKNSESMAVGLLTFFLVGIPTNYLVEYGTFAFPMVLVGYILRHGSEMKLAKLSRGLSIATLCGVFIAANIIMFDFHTAQAVCAVGIMILTTMMMAGFSPASFPELTRMMGRPVSWMIRMGGRYTLEYYIIHLLILKITLFMLEGDKYKLFQPTLFPHVE
ncbi:MAG: TraX family protein [Pseudobdellovibrionaceae bacterium]